jgi:hypothetical protein
VFFGYGPFISGSSGLFFGSGRASRPKLSGTVPTNRHTTIPSDSGRCSVCVEDDPKL